MILEGKIGKMNISQFLLNQIWLVGDPNSKVLVPESSKKKPLKFHGLSLINYHFSTAFSIGGFLKSGYPQMVGLENPIQRDDLWVPPFQETSI